MTSYHVCVQCCRQRVRDQIALDRADKEARAAAEKAASSSPTKLPAQQLAQPPTVSTPSVKKEYTTCRLQVTCSVKIIP